MNKKILVFVSAVFFLLLAGCSGSTPSGQLPGTGGTQSPTQQSQAGTTAATTAPNQAPAAAPTQPAASTPEATTSPSTSGAPAPNINPVLATRLSNTCDLLNSNDLAKILVTGELVKEPVQTTPVEHPIFSTANVPVTEVNCVYYEYHNPGKKDQELLQVTYWLDMPGQGVADSAWQNVWSEAVKNGQPLSEIGTDAFTGSNGELTFKQDNFYFTLQIVDTSRTTAQNAQIQQQIAKDMLNNLALMQKSGE